MSDTITTVMTEEEILSAPESDYMNEAQQRFFKQRLLDLYEATCDHIQHAKEEMEAPMGFSDELDRASSEEQSMIALRIIDREQKLLPKIQQSLTRLYSSHLKMLVQREFLGLSTRHCFEDLVD
ncbi:hypothetical protein [Thaumasiovibrio subtropicus]|uniref:hypothetical protein n=1 Tax=Thaumasiovibrio subtropicus TaxID=1891207 RepID=UPI001FE80B2B|nr:hypothetical protein [Thaumasiovibrio subtropicus]